MGITLQNARLKLVADLSPDPRPLFPCSAFRTLRSVASTWASGSSCLFAGFPSGISAWADWVFHSVAWTFIFKKSWPPGVTLSRSLAGTSRNPAGSSDGPAAVT